MRAPVAHGLGGGRWSVLFVVAACLGASTALGLSHQTREGRPLGPAAKVVVVGMPHLSLSDLAGGRAPALEALADRGGLGALNVRTLSRVPSAPEAYATLGAGARVAVTADAMNQGAADDAPASASGGSSTRDVPTRLVPQAPRLVADARARHLSSAPGALGTALGAAHLRTGVVSTAGASALAGVAVPPPPTALAVMNASGDVGSTAVVTGAELGEPSPVGATSSGQFVAATLEMLGRVDVVVIDQTEPDRRPRSDPSGAVAPARDRDAAVQTTDDFVGQLALKLAPDVLVVVVGIEPPTDTWELTPIIVAGPGVARGGLVSPTTKRVGLVTLEDIAPSILSALGLPVVAGMTGRPFTISDHPTGVGSLVALNRDAVYRERVYGPAALAYIALQGSLYLAAVVILRPGNRRGRGPFSVRSMRMGALVVAAVPLASYLWRALPGMAGLGWVGLGILGVLASAVAAAAGADHRRPLNPLRWILAATVGLLLIDLATGARLQPASLLGYSLHTASRFYGLGNTALAVLMTASVLTAGLYLGAAPDRQRALSQVTGFFVVVAFIAASPLLGAKVGAVLTLVPVFGAGLWRFSGRRLTPAAVAELAMAVVASLVSLGALDALRPPDQRTHLGGLVSSIAHGRFAAFGLVVERKLGTTLRLVSTNTWSALLAVSAVVALYLLVATQRGAHLLPLGTPLRTAVVATVAGGLLGVVVNDSGSVMVAMVFVYLGPLLVLLACGRSAQPEDLVFGVAPGGDAHPRAVMPDL